MLLNEWFAWWGDIPPIRADEHLDAYLVHMLGDSGWTMDRDSVLDAWRAVAGREANKVVRNGDVIPARYQNDGSYEDDGEKLRAQFHRARRWLAIHYGRGITD